MIIVLAEIHKKSDAQKIAKALLKQRIIACYSIWPVESAYWWKGKILDDKGTLMMLKTKEQLFARVEEYIKKHSGYEVPEVIGIKADRVNQTYLDWINSETK